MNSMSDGWRRGAFACWRWTGVCRPRARQSAADSGATLFQNVRIFDGKGASLSAPSNVLVKGNIIERISTTPIAAEPGVTVIAGNGRTLMPGLIDAHWHAMLIRPTPAQAIAGDVGYNNLAAGAEATDTLMRGFTTVRDVGGPVFGLKQRHRRGHRRGPAHLSVRCHDHRHQRTRRFPPVVRTAADDRRHAQPHGADRRQHGRRQPRRGARPRPRATDAGRLPDQADGWRRRFVAVQPARRVDLHRAGTARRSRGGRQLGHLRHRACLYAGWRSSGRSPPV